MRMQHLHVHAERLIERRDSMNEQLEAMNAQSLPREVYEYWDDELVTLMQERLTLFSDLSNSVAVPMPLEKTDYVWWTSTGGFHVQWDMDFDPMVDLDGVEATPHSVLVPIVRGRFGWGFREAQNVTSNAIFSLGAEARVQSFYAVQEAAEDMCLYGPKVRKSRVGQGLLNYTGRNQGNFGNFDLNGTTGDNWRKAVYYGLDLQRQNLFGGLPTTMYVNDGDWMWANSTPYDTSGGMGATSIATFIRGMGVNIVEVPSLPPNNLLFVVKRTNVVALPFEEPISIRAEKERIDPTEPYRFVTVGVFSLAPKQDDDGHCGITHMVKGTRS